MTTILIVDNEPYNTSAKNVCGSADIISLLDCIYHFKPNFYSLCILDINMPNMNNGYEFYREITASEDYNETLRVWPGLLDGVNYFIPKPVDIDEFLSSCRT